MAVAAIATAGLVAVRAVDDDTRADERDEAAVQAAAAAEPSTPAPGEDASVQVEMMLNAERAEWQPEGGGTGTLVLDDVDPRLVMMAVAPRRETVVVPVSMLAANWEPLFASTGNETNILLAAEQDGRRELVPFRARLVDGHPSGRQLSFAVSALDQGAHTLDHLGDAAATLEGVSVLVDPTITDQIKAMWDALVAFFTGQNYELPPNPTYDEDGKTYYTDGFDFESEHAKTYKGPPGGDITDPANRTFVQNEVIDAFEGDVDSWLFGDDDIGWLLKPGTSYDGLSLFDGSPGVRISGSADARTAVTDSAFFEMNLKRLEISNGDIGGLNMRGTATDVVQIDNSAFDTVDFTGATLGSGDATTSPAERSTVSNSVFENVSANEATRSPIDDNKPDRAAGDPGVELRNIDFTSVSFRNVNLGSTTAESATFQGCGLSGVDFTGSIFNGGTGQEPGEIFEPTFDNSILENVSFDRAFLDTVSFRGVDFSGGGISFDGAVLSNVDFTGATGLQNIDWSTVTIAGDVYGLESVAHQIDFGDHPEYFRYLTFDGEKPEIDADTGFDIDPNEGWLIDPGTGVRVERDGFSGELVPVDPVTREPFTSPDGNQLKYDGEKIFDPVDLDAHYEVDYFSGELEIG
jgi:uncharacterized protein YjbI with pentapeptide repeats